MSAVITQGKQRHRGTRDGQAAVEFGLAMPFMVLMVVGSFCVGMMFDRYLTLTQLARNAGNMYARGIDFSSAQNREVLLRSATGLNITTDAGDGVVYLSLVVMAPPGSGANENQPVVTQRYFIGNTGVRSSGLGSPPTTAEGSVPDYYNEPLAVATLPAAVASRLRPSERLFIAESAYIPRELEYAPIFSVDQLYARAYF